MNEKNLVTPKTFIIAIGCKARQGKDTIANFIKKHRKNSYIFHWADGVYDECRNSKREYPLIKKIDVVNFKNEVTEFYMCLDDFDKNTYRIFSKYEIPSLHEFMKSKNVIEYWGMEDKDSILLQIWGTDYRRTHFSQDYWINKTMQHIFKSHQVDENQNTYICIPDTRFYNEYSEIINEAFRLDQDYINWRGIFVRVIRLNDDGTQFIDPGRNPNHSSETDLDNCSAKYTFIAKTGDLYSLESQTLKFLEELDSQ